MTVRKGAFIAAMVAVVAYAPALRNGFTLDDTPIVEENPRAHDIGLALRAFDEPWWPPPHDAGQWRPLTILSFAADWQLSGGSTVCLHAVNVLWHAAATGLLVLVLAPFSGAGGALAGALVFAVHPVHVEAVANLVGRAELMAAVFLLLALLCARAVRAAAAAGRRTWSAELAMLACVALGLLSKEHAAVAVALLVLDEWALGGTSPGERLPRRAIVAALALTLAWFLARRSVEGGRSFVAVAPTFFGLDVGGRLSTMLPTVFEVVRLLVWPFTLSPDYHPEVVPRLTHPTALGLAGALLLASLVALAVLLWRRSRGASAALWFTGIAYLPTSNLLFPSGIVLAERALYLPSVGVALLAALGVERLRTTRRLAMGILAVALVAGAVRTVTRIPVWSSSRALVLDGVLTRPESYKVRQAAARVLMKTGRGREALREYALAAELYGHDPYLLTEAGSAALALREPRLALRFLERSYQLDSNYTLTRQLLERARAAVSLR